MTETRTEPVAAPPVALVEPQQRRIHGERLEDPYAWLRQRDDPRVQAHLEAENAYTDRVLAHTEELQERLYREMVGRIQETDRSVPVAIDEYFYYRRTERGLQYPIYCRKKSDLEAPEEVLLDLNALAAAESYLQLGVFAVSPDHRLLAYSLDRAGAERFTLHVLDLERGELRADVIENTAHSLAWAENSRTLYYATLDSIRRPDKAWRHVVGEDPARDELVHHEPDERFFLSLGKTRSRRFLLLGLESHTTSEIRYLDLEREERGWRLLAPRRQGVEMSLDHRGGSFYVLTNEEAPNFRLMEASIESPERESWREIVAERDDVKLETLDLFRSHLVLGVRSGGLKNLRVHAFESGEWHQVDFDEPVYTVAVDDNPTFDASVLRFAYSSLVTPLSIYDYRMDGRERELRKRTPVPGYDPGLYASERLEAVAPDGTRVPVSVVYRQGLERDGGTPAVLYGYGAYGSSIEPRFSAVRLSLLDRGFVFAIAHVRGGGELGEAWRQAGKLERKRNTFTDFIAAAEHLFARGFTTPERLAIRGGSAGGMLIGAVLNERPDLAAAALAEVPFVDVLNTMLDPTLPLTVIEYEEWGNPQEPEAFETIRAYSPYDNVAERRYPHLLVTAGLNDPRVQYWEPAKWLAKLRAHNRGDSRLLMRIDMSSGHGGASGRYDALREEAFKLAFVLDVVGSE